MAFKTLTNIHSAIYSRDVHLECKNVQGGDHKVRAETVWIRRAEGLCSAASERSAVRVPAGTVFLSVVKITAKWGFMSSPTLHTKEVKKWYQWGQWKPLYEWLAPCANWLPLEGCILHVGDEKGSGMNRPNELGVICTVRRACKWMRT